MKIMRTVIIVFLLMAISSFVLCNARADITDSTKTTHIETMLESPFLTLVLNAEVTLPIEDAELTIYASDYPVSEDAKWREMFFGSQDSPVTDLLAGMSAEQMAAEGCYYPEFEHAYEADNVFTRYFSAEARLIAIYRNRETLRWVDEEKRDAQAIGLECTPEKAQLVAQDWINSLSKTIGWDGLTASRTYAVPATEFGALATEMDEPLSDDSDYSSPFYLVEFCRRLDGIPIAHDTPVFNDSSAAHAEITGDMMQLCIDDEGIFRADGYFRSYTAEKTEKLAVSIEAAIEIVQENMDYVYAFRDDSAFTIDEIELCYRLVQTRDTSDKDACARTQARPAWRFASAVNRYSTTEFVIFVDASTGDILP